MVFSSICFGVVLIIACFYLFADTSKHKKKTEEELPHYHPESIKTMFKSYGWGDRKVLELSIKHCTNCFHKEEDNFYYTRENKVHWLRSREILEKELQEFDKKNNIVIKHIPITADKEAVFKFIKNEPELTYAISEHRKNLEKNKIEVFYQKQNIIVTEEGYYGAWFENQLVKTQNNE